MKADAGNPQAVFVALAQFGALLDVAGDLRVSFISREDLVAAKLVSGRPRDLADVDELRKAEAG